MIQDGLIGFAVFALTVDRLQWFNTGDYPWISLF